MWTSAHKIALVSHPARAEVLGITSNVFFLFHKKMDHKRNSSFTILNANNPGSDNFLSKFASQKQVSEIIFVKTRYHIHKRKACLKLNLKYCRFHFCVIIMILYLLRNMFIWFTVLSFFPSDLRQQTSKEKGGVLVV